MLVEVIMPQLGESIFEGTLTRWLKKTGDSVARDEALFEISTDKVDSEIPSPASGILREIRIQEGETVPVNTIVAVLEEAEMESLESAIDATFSPSTPLLPPSAPLPGVPGKIRSSPLVRQLAREQAVDLSRLTGTGLGGRISKKDILQYLNQRRASPASLDVTAPAAAPELTDVPSSQSARTEAVPMSAMRRNIAEHMLASRRTSAHVTTIFEVDMTPICRLREKMQFRFQEKTGCKLTFMPFFLKASAESLGKFPLLNASLEGTNIIYKMDINIGVAVSLDWGLIVPVIHKVESRTFSELTLILQDLASRARNKKLDLKEVQDGTFTITNPGVFGSLMGTPIIHQPQVAILCIGAITKRPVVIEDAIAIRSMAYLSLTYDHRLIDGAVADQFMASLKKHLEGWGDLPLD
jgi:pyruvate dehydrogenase E2 component (dihydrolipoamide acetyltransferase)